MVEQSACQAEGRGFAQTGGRLPDPHRPLQILRNIEANPQVALVFDRYNDDWERLAWVLLRGRASLVTDAGEKAQAVAALRRKYPQYRTMALEERPLIRLEPERAASWGAVSE